MDKQKIDIFWKKRTAVSDPRIATHYKHDDCLRFDIALVKKFSQPYSHVLDLGSGTCAISNIILDDVGSITAVEKQKEFFRFCRNSPKLKRISCDILDFHDEESYDLVLLFGVSNFITYDESVLLYERVAKLLLKKSGVFIAKHACGVNEEVIIDTFSETVGDTYHARYPYFQSEEKLLKRFFKKVEVIDIYPKRLNPWNNTHYYAFICTDPF